MLQYIVKTLLLPYTVFMIFDRLRIFLKTNQKRFLLITHISLTVVTIIVFFFITQKFRPQPISDFKEYWLLASDLKSYFKGGLLFILYLPLKTLNLQPYTCSFIVNSFCFIVLSYLLWIKGKKKLQPLATFILLLSGIWFSGFIPIVNSDIPTVIFLLFGIRILLKNIKNNNKFHILYLGIIPTVIGLTMRSQFLYAFFFLSLVLLTVYFFSHKKKISSILKNFTLFIVFSTLIAFTMNWVLEQQSQNQSQIEIHKRVPFYTGLIETTVKERCGRFNVPAVTLAEKEIEQPLIQLLIKKYRNISVKRYLQIFTCKWENYFFNYNQSSVGWLRSHLKLNETLNKFNNFYFYLWDYVEGISVHLLKLISTFLYLLFLYNFRKKSKIEKILFICLSYILLFFLAVHTIMEIQPRYLISPVIFTTIIMIYLHTEEFKKM